MQHILNWDWTLITQIIAFLVLFWLLSRLFGKRVSAMLRQRADRIEAGLRAAEENQRRAEQMHHETQRQLDEARAERQSIVAAAHKAAEAQRQALIAQARGEADALVQRTQAAIQRERQAAVDELRREAGRLAVVAARRLIGDALDARTSRELADKAIVDIGRRD
jgi:F-type H+-transporting ATPase subunit b